MRHDIKNGVFHIGDCFDVMAKLPDASVDMVLCDLPYGTTQNKWDSVLPLDALWREYWRIAKPNAAVVLTASQPFTSALIMGQIQHFRYEWIWKKNMGSGFAAAKYQPMRYHESVLIFYKQRPVYNPQPTARNSTASENVCKRPVRSGANKSNHTPMSTVMRQYDPKSKGPESVLSFDSVPNGGGGKLHPTQKPVDLFEYLIRTYTNEGMTVLDNTAGSGTTAIAAERSNRRWICIERDEGYAAKAIERIRAEITA